MRLFLHLKQAVVVVLSVSLMAVMVWLLVAP